MISFNTSQAQHYRASSNLATWNQSPAFNLEATKKQFHPTPVLRPPSNSFTQSYQNQQKSASSSRGISDLTELNQDLNRLKEQLRRLSNQQQDKKLLQPNRQSLLQKQGDRPKSNLSSDSHLHFRKDFSYQTLNYPAQNINPPKNEDSKSMTQKDQRQSLNQQRVEGRKIVPIVNPNKRQSERWSNMTNPENKLRINHHQQELVTLRQRITSLQNELQTYRQENENLSKELKDINEKLQSKESQVQKLQQQHILSEGQLKKQIQVERSQHLEIVQKVYQQLNRAKKQIAIPVNVFDQTFKKQQEANQELRRKLQEKSQETHSLIDQISEQFKTIQDMKSQLQIQPLKIGAEFKAKIQRLEIAVSDRQNQILSLKRALETLDSRYKSSLKELQQKDEFILKYMVHRSIESQRDEIHQFFSTYKSKFSTPATLQLFLQEQQELEHLKKKAQTI